MNALRVRGLWYLPGKDDNLVAGTLTFNAVSGLRLSLTGSFESESLLSSSPVQIIHGFIEKAYRGCRVVTLHRSLRTKARISMPGFPTEEFRATTAYFSDHPISGDTVFNGCRVRLQYMDQWAAAGRGMSGTGVLDNWATFSYEKPKALVASGSGLDVTLDYDLVVKRSRNSFRAKERGILAVQSKEALNATAVVRGCVRPFVDLLIFATDGSVGLREVDLCSRANRGGAAQECEWVPFVFSPTTGSENRPLADPEMLFTVGHLADGFSDLIREWVDLRERRESFFNAFFGLIAAPPRFGEVRFSWLLHCVSLLAFEERAASIRPSTGTSEPLPVADALRWLMDQTISLHRELLSGDADTFIAKTLEAHRLIKRGGLIDPISLRWTDEVLRWVVKGWLLLQLSPLAPQAPALLNQNQHLAFAKTKI
jgi:hypothetical protein